MSGTKDDGDGWAKNKSVKFTVAKVEGQMNIRVPIKEPEEIGLSSGVPSNLLSMEIISYSHDSIRMPMQSSTSSSLCRGISQDPNAKTKEKEIQL